jgi:hypothetical protein
MKIIADTISTVCLSRSATVQRCSNENGDIDAPGWHRHDYCIGDNFSELQQA